MKIVFLDSENHFTQSQKERLAKLGEIRFIEGNGLSEREVVEYLKGAEIAAVAPSAVEHLGAETLAACGRLRGIAVATTGFDFVDVEAAARKGIAVANVPGYATESVAEHTFGLIFSLTKQISRADRDIRRGKASFRDYLGWEIRGKKLGIVGLGEIGRRVAQIGRCWEMEVLAFTRTPRELAGVRLVGWDELLSLSDVVSLHTPLTERTRGMLGRREFELMKETAILINTAREEIVEAGAVYQALKEGKIAGYGFEQSEFSSDEVGNLLLRLDQVVSTPHSAFYTQEALARQAEIWVGNVEAMVKEKPQNVVNLPMASSVSCR